MRPLLIVLILLSVYGANAQEDDAIRFRLEQHHIDQLRRVRVSWDGAETGAPCLEPSGEYPKDLLYALQIAVLFGRLNPGKFVYSKPLGGDVEYSPLSVEELPEASSFWFQDDHRELLKHSVIQNSEVGWDGESVPGCDPKRPYGDFSYYQLEMAKHLHRPTTKNSDGYHQISEELESELTLLHHTMQAAWQVFLENFELEPGLYEGDEWGNWTPQ